MSKIDSGCPFCGATLIPDSSLCPVCGRSIFQAEAGGQKIQPPQPPQPRQIALTRRNIIIGVVVLLLVAIIPLIIFLNASRSGGNGDQSHAQPLAPGSTPSPASTSSAANPTTPALSPTPATPNPTASATTNNPPVVSLPCTVNLNTWTGGSADWVTHNGILYSDGTNNASESDGPTIVAPCQPGVPNYALEAKIQVTHPSNCFGLVFHATSGQNGWQGYRAGVCGPNSNIAYIQAYGDYNPLAQVPYTSNTSVHTYRVEIKDTTIKLFIDGNLIVNTSDNRLLTVASGEEVGLYSAATQIQVTGFQVTALP